MIREKKVSFKYFLCMENVPKKFVLFFFKFLSDSILKQTNLELTQLKIQYYESYLCISYVQTLATVFSVFVSVIAFYNHNRYNRKNRLLQPKPQPEQPKT